MAPRSPNPYRPGFNQAPLALAGREAVLRGIYEALDVAALDGRTPRPLVLTGGRGVGKTVLLGEAAAGAAERHSWLTVPVEVRPDMRFISQLVERLLLARDLYQQTPAGKRVAVAAATVRASVLGVGGEIEFRRRDDVTEEPSLPLDRALAAVCEKAVDHGAGLVVTVDEVQLANRTEIGDFAATLQQHVPDNWPLVVILAGLPSIRSAQRGVTYLERAEWHVLSMLEPTDARSALQDPAREAGRPMSDAAAEMLAEATGGYPYAVQLFGHHAWRASTGSATIEKRHALPAITAAQAELAGGLYAARWADTSPREKEYLAALARRSDGSRAVTGALVADELSTTTKALSAVRERLINKGVVYAEGTVVRFAIPGMAAWVRDETPG